MDAAELAIAGRSIRRLRSPAQPAAESTDIEGTFTSGQWASVLTKPTAEIDSVLADLPALELPDLDPLAA